ncbi:MAG: hypothetical protein HC831_25875 [Chloroflexia bacterium]|nr:hypothetical protein [Chloroflexia bacterium]
MLDENLHARKDDDFLSEINVSNTGLQKAIKDYYLYISHLNKLASFCTNCKLLSSLAKEYNKSKFSIAELRRIINNTQLINHLALSFYYNQIEEPNFRFSKLMPVVIPQNAYLKKGVTYKAKIFLTAIDTNLEMRLIIPNDTLFSANGVIKFTEYPETDGKRSIPAVIEVKKPNTKAIMKYPTKIEYEVIK